LTRFVALDHVSLQIPKGDFVTLLGPSGCGKTTLMRQVAGFSEPDEGDVLINGRRMNGMPPYKRNTPLVFQEYALFPHMTVWENISYGLRLRKLPREEVDRKVGQMLEMFNLVGLEKRFPKEMSGGQQQRVAFARALVMGQEILLLDEPLSNLDAKLRVEVRTELRQIQQKLGITTIYVTHDQGRGAVHVRPDRRDEPRHRGADRHPLGDLLPPGKSVCGGLRGHGELPERHGGGADGGGHHGLLLRPHPALRRAGGGGPGGAGDAGGPAGGAAAAGRRRKGAGGLCAAGRHHPLQLPGPRDPLLGPGGGADLHRGRLQPQPLRGPERGRWSWRWMRPSCTCCGTEDNGW
jgi:ABC-type nitrate/sulfonate/bicarbonate transport system ATPase subunit